MMYGSWDMKCDRQNFFVIFGHFSPFYPPERWKYQKWKKKPGDIIILYWLYCSRDMTCDGCNCYFHFGLYFSLLLPPNSPKNQNFIKMKKNPGDIIILHQCPKNHDHMLYCSWEMEHDKCNCYFSFWPILCPFNNPKNQNFKKQEINSWRYHYFTQVYQKLWLDDVQFLRYVAWQTDRQTDGRMDGRTDGSDM